MAKRSSIKLSQRTTELRNSIFENMDESRLWSRLENVGFTTIPRTMPLIMQIMDILSLRKPVSSTYLDLWCLVFDESFLQITNPSERAHFAGFSGTRAAYTWGQRMRQLMALGFIDCKSGASGPFHFVLIVNPHLIIQELREKNPMGFPEELYRTLIARKSAIGAKD